MKWFRHMTDASDDEFIVELEEIFGLEGYARWWKLLETVAAQMDKTDRCSASYPWSKWQKILRGKQKKLETFLEHLQNKQRISKEQTGNVLKITIPKLLSMRDNYTKNLQASSSPTGKQEVEVEVEVEKKEPGAAAPTFWDVGKSLGLTGSIIGRQIKQAGEEHVARVISEMSIKRPAEPTQYFVAATTKKKRGAVV